MLPRIRVIPAPRPRIAVFAAGRSKSLPSWAVESIRMIADIEEQHMTDLLVGWILRMLDQREVELFGGRDED